LLASSESLDGLQSQLVVVENACERCVLASVLCELPGLVSRHDEHGRECRLESLCDYVEMAACSLAFGGDARFEFTKALIDCAKAVIDCFEALVDGLEPLVDRLESLMNGAKGGIHFRFQLADLHP